LPGIGEGIQKKIEEVLDNGEFRKVGVAFNDPVKSKQIEELQNIWGVGPVKADSLWHNGHKTVAKLRALNDDKLSQTLTKVQIIGLRHYEDLLERIPRAEAAKLIEKVESAVNKLFPKRKIEVMACGSFRRGK